MATFGSKLFNKLRNVSPKKSSLTYRGDMHCLPKPVLAAFSFLLSTTNAEDPIFWRPLVGWIDTVEVVKQPAMRIDPIPVRRERA